MTGTCRLVMYAGIGWVLRNEPAVLSRDTSVQPSQALGGVQNRHRCAGTESTSELPLSPGPETQCNGTRTQRHTKAARWCPSPAGDLRGLLVTEVRTAPRSGSQYPETSASGKRGQC
ncbi:hypothetical protein AAFF_G00269040 [Aldrovandia affinis]|uniref:Uncharacterized protein n=1 Tax=Aldrovandia affinis TaxID=143900 RepID=A0AAD7SSM2_9TELE|nr:hypothetical protein AAFF_G00269040 [Aldrovandia affinis]